MERSSREFRDSSPDPRSRKRKASEDAGGDRKRRRIEREYFAEKIEESKEKCIIFSRFNANIKEILDIIHPNTVSRDNLKKVNNLLISFCKLLPISKANVDQLAEHARQSEQWRDYFRMDKERKDLLDFTKGKPMDEQFPIHQDWLRHVPSTYRVEQATKIYNSLVGKQPDLAVDYIGDYMMSAYHMNRIESIIISKGLNIKVPNQNTQEWEYFANEIYVNKEGQNENENILIMVGDILKGGVSRRLSEDDRNSAEYINQMTDILTQWNERAFHNKPHQGIPNK